MVDLTSLGPIFSQNPGVRSPLNILSAISAHCPFRHGAPFRQWTIRNFAIVDSRGPIIYARSL
ncbi:hypothetical protein PILCRDRAFT_829487 [Piloderma croceum F 1598]|uniref:Uncharacterized protein n=1 Tax=Piloderma croceum (strain F 1598) TaxID=765440 RepID=A0A0C3EYA0_PILCF|nr:hypothetical protein PILCRDRAFT_829487 [Piloderma croceum F 1598]